MRVLQRDAARSAAHEAFSNTVFIVIHWLRCDPLLDLQLDYGQHWIPPALCSGMANALIGVSPSGARAWLTKEL